MIKKALIPAAGFGTRLLPATKSQPKEMLPVVDKPVIQYVVEEAVRAGIKDILIVVSSGKQAIEAHFNQNFELEYRLAEKGKKAALENLRQINQLANIHFIWQQELNGLGDAVHYGRFHIGNEPFAVLLGDTILESNNEQSITQQLVNVYNKYKSSVVALEEVPRALVSRYGVMGGKKLTTDGIYQVEELVEKPLPEVAPSNLVIASRYIFTPEIFDCLENLPKGINDEIQLTDAMRLLLNKQNMYGLQFKGKRHDVGNKLGFIKTNLSFALKRKELSPDLKSWLVQLRTEGKIK